MVPGSIYNHCQIYRDVELKFPGSFLQILNIIELVSTVFCYDVLREHGSLTRNESNGNRVTIEYEDER